MPDLRAVASNRFNTLRSIISSPSWARAWFWRRYGAPEGCFHVASNTMADRYPAVFLELRDRLGALESCRVLSFGCSTGEEVFALRHYLPHAEIVGIDINPSSITQAKQTQQKLGNDPNIAFHAASSCVVEPLQSFDAILAMTVFCSGRLRLEQPASCAGLLSFAAFDAEIGRFAERLKPDGLLIVGNANFRVDDTAFAKQLPVIKRFDDSVLPGLPRPIYGPDESLLVGATDPGAMYRRAS